MAKTNKPNPLKYFNDEKAKRLQKAQKGQQVQDARIKDLQSRGYEKDNARAVEFYHVNPSDTLDYNHYVSSGNGPIVPVPKKKTKSKK